MCTYNGARYIEEQLLSIGAQTMQPFELVVCDDGSRDGTAAIVECFRSSASFAVRLYRNETNLGSTKNFEKAIGLCEGEAIALCDQDDRWSPEKLRVSAAILVSRPEVAGVFSNASLIDESGRRLPGSLWQRSGFGARRQKAFTRRTAPYQLVRRDTVTGACLIFRSNYIPQILPIAEDWVHDGWTALILASSSQLAPVPSCLVEYRLHQQQQIGASEVPWRAHLSTPKTLAIAAHRREAARFERMVDRLANLDAGPDIVSYVRRKAEFLRSRELVLSTSRPSRLPPIVRRAADYVRFDKGLMSMLRDLLH